MCGAGPGQLPVHQRRETDLVRESKPNASSATVRVEAAAMLSIMMPITFQARGDVFLREAPGGQLGGLRTGKGLGQRAPDLLREVCVTLTLCVLRQFLKGGDTLLTVAFQDLQLVA